MDEILQLVVARFTKIEELHQGLKEGQIQRGEILRKAKEEEKHRRDKENWILNVLRSVKFYHQAQKQVLFEKSILIMIMIWPGFKEIWKNYFELNQLKFDPCSSELIMKLFEVFFTPFQAQFSFRLTHFQVIRTSQNMNVLAEIFKYLIEFTRDCFKKALLYIENSSFSSENNGSLVAKEKNQTSFISQSQAERIFKSEIKRGDLKVFPSTICLERYYKNQDQQSIVNADENYLDIYEYQIQNDNKWKRIRKEFPELKTGYLQLMETMKQRNSQVINSISKYQAEYSSKYPQEYGQFLQQTEKQDCRDHLNSILNCKKVWKIVGISDPQCAQQPQSFIYPVMLSSQSANQLILKRGFKQLDNSQNIIPLKIVKLTENQCKISPFLYPDASFGAQIITPIIDSKKVSIAEGNNESLLSCRNSSINSLKVAFEEQMLQKQAQSLSPKSLLSRKISFQESFRKINVTPNSSFYQSDNLNINEKNQNSNISEHINNHKKIIQNAIPIQTYITRNENDNNQGAQSDLSIGMRIDQQDSLTQTYYMGDKRKGLFKGRAKCAPVCFSLELGKKRPLSSETTVLRETSEQKHPSSLAESYTEDKLPKVMNQDMRRKVEENSKLKNSPRKEKYNREKSREQEFITKSVQIQQQIQITRKFYERNCESKNYFIKASNKKVAINLLEVSKASNSVPKAKILREKEEDKCNYNFFQNQKQSKIKVQQKSLVEILVPPKPKVFCNTQRNSFFQQQDSAALNQKLYSVAPNIKSTFTIQTSQERQRKNSVYLLTEQHTERKLKKGEKVAKEGQVSSSAIRQEVEKVFNKEVELNNKIRMSMRFK